MILEQHYLGCLSQASYLIGDEETATAIVVDPRRDVGVYLHQAELLGLTIRHIFLTHFHADFVAGHLELRDRCNATIHLGPRAQADFAFSPFGESDQLEFGQLRLRALETPGHTPEGICLLVYDLAADREQPHAILTGDTLFLGDVGRPDLMASVGTTAEELGEQLYDSLHQKILPLPDSTLVYPGHGAGSLCGKAMSQETYGTLGDQRATNYALQPMAKTNFVRLVAAAQPPPPAYFLRAARLNGQEHGVLVEDDLRALPHLEIDAFLHQVEEGAQVLDGRSPEEFAELHLPGSFNVGLDGRFATWAGAVLDPLRPIVLIAPPGRAGEAALRLARVGLDLVAGSLAGGIDGLGARPDLGVCVQRLDPAGLKSSLDSASPPQVLDVRQPGEREVDRIPGSQHIPLAQLPARLGEVPDGPLVLQCARGYRSMVALSLVAADRGSCAGLTDLRGGMEAWHGLNDLPGSG